MKASEITLGGVYVAKVTGKLAKVRVENIVEHLSRGCAQMHYRCVNLATGRPVTVKSCQRFLSQDVACQSSITGSVATSSALQKPA